MRFHRRCGDRVTLLNDNSTAIRNFVEFNHGLILSAEPLEDDVLFEISIDRKVNVWNGSLEIGVTTLDPEYMELPATATKLRNTAWILSGSSVVRDGVTLVNSYGPELDTLLEGDCLGVVRTSKDELMFYVNGRCLGAAAKGLPSRLFAVIDLYGQCVQVSILHCNPMRTIMDGSLDQIEEDPNNDDTLTSSGMDVAGLPPETYPKPVCEVYIPMSEDNACALVAQDRLRFHPRCGILIKLSNNNKSAERARPLDDYNNGVVMSHRPLYDNELFEIRIDRLVDKWSGSIEVGVTTHNPATIRFPSTMTNMDTGTIMMSGCKVLLNGHGTCLEYGNFNLDELREGDTVGMMRKDNGNLHYFINGVDQGVAADKLDQPVWGVIDLYGMTVKITIIDPCEDMDTNISNGPSNAIVPAVSELSALNRYRARIDEDSLLFHTLRDSNVIIINYGKTAHRPNAFEYFNNGIVMTNRTLRTNELFQVRLDLVIPKWAGSIEIGITQHSSKDIKFPFKMSNAKSGTWAMTGEDVIRDGTIIIPQYVRNLNKLVEGDTVGVMRKNLGILHFYVNGVDQGPAAFNIPEHVFGIIDLYGRVAQATIVDQFSPAHPYSPDSPLSIESNGTMHSCNGVPIREMCFHRVHGRNARLSRDRMTASRCAVYSEFNDSVLFSSRPLRECDMFELRIDKMVDCWIGSLEIGVTAIRPEDLEASGGVGAIAGTATDLSWDTYILSGAAMMKDGECVRSGYPLDLDTLTVGSRVGIMWHADRTLHYYLDGMDMGKAWYVPHLNIYAVIDLYGQCTQVTIMQNDERAFNYNGCHSDHSLLSHGRSFISPPPPYWSFSEYCGDNICLMHDYSMARRLIASDNTCTLIFSSAHLAVGEIFEIKIMEFKHSYAGTFRVGVTDVNILNANVNRNFPPTISGLPHYVAYIDGGYMHCSMPGTREQTLRTVVPSFEWLRPGDRVGLKRSSDQRVLVYVNSELLDVAFDDVPDKVYAVMELSGQTTKIMSVARNSGVGIIPQITIPNDEASKPGSSNDVEIEAADAEGLDDVTSPEPYIDVAIRLATQAEVEPPRDDDAKNTDYEVAEVPEAAEEVEELPVEGEPAEEVPMEEVPAEEVPVEEVAAEEVAAEELPAEDGPAEEGPAEERPVEEGPAEVKPAEERPAEEGPAEERPAEEAPAENQGSGGDASEDAPPEDPDSAAAAPPAEPRRRRYPLPYTFHYIHGKNIKLCSSDTVAIRTSGFSGGVVIVSQPLRRGHNFRFRVDKIYPQWEGTVTIGAIGVLPTEPLPPYVFHIEPPVWLLSSDLVYDNGTYTSTTMAEALEADVGELSMLTIYFRFNGEIMIALDGRVLGSIGAVPSHHRHVFPLIDLYGKVKQVSVLLHPSTIACGTSLDLPIIAEHEETLIEMGPIEEADVKDTQDLLNGIEPQLKPKETCETLEVVADVHYDPEPGPSSSISYQRRDREERRSCQTNRVMSTSKTATECEGADNMRLKLCMMTKSHSTQNFKQTFGEPVIDADVREALKTTISLELGAEYADNNRGLFFFCDTNKRQNDRFPEATEDDSIDNELVDALALEQGNMPDLTEEPSLSLDESTRRDDFWAETLSVENLNYLNHILSQQPEIVEGPTLESMWEASGVNCEHLHLVLKYWTFLVHPFPEMRQAVTWNQVRCYCSICQPDAQPPFAGWVRIERVESPPELRRAYWHVARPALGAAHASAGPARRPRSMTTAPYTYPPVADIWLDEESKPHHTVLAIEIDVEGPDATEDRILAFLIYLKSHVAFLDETLPSLED